MDGKQCAPASIGLRIANFIVDSILQFFFAMVLSLILAIFVHDFFKVGVFFYLVSLLQIYYIFFEGTWQRTPGKWITGTKVVRKDGHAPTFGQVLGRSFSRLVPFEVLSFLVGPNPRGWHDRFTKTLVVPSDYTVADVANIDWVEMKKKQTYKWLYVVIGIWVGLILLSIIATIALVALGSAQSKGHDAKIMSTVSAMRAQAQLWSPAGGPQAQDLSTDQIGDNLQTEDLSTDSINGGTLFTDNLPDNSLYPLIQKLPAHTSYFYGSEEKLPSDGGRWFFASTISGDDYVCVDYTGTINRVTKTGQDLQWEDVFPRTATDLLCN